MAASGQVAPIVADMSVARCPTDVSHVADLYLLGRLNPSDAAAFEEHFLQCSPCASSVQLAYDFMTSLADIASMPRCLWQRQQIERSSGRHDRTRGHVARSGV